MIEKIKKVEVTQLMDKVDITEQLSGNTVTITLSDDSQISIELFERDGDNAIQVKSTGANRIQVIPVASNVIKVREER